jgi:hypothetical protein
MTAGRSIDPLEWRFPPHPREPATGYASRLAALNGESLVTLMLASGISYRKVHTGEDAAVRDVAALGGLDATATETLRRFSPRRQGPANSSVGTERLSWRSLLTGYCRFCPRCVARDLVESHRDVPMAARSWLRIEWMVDQIRSCQSDGVRLVETERVTGFPAIVDFSAQIARDVLPGLERLCDEAVPADPNAFEEWVLRRLNGDRDPDNWLDSLPLYAAVDACEAMGFETLEKGGPVFSQLGAAEKAVASLAGYRIARGAEAGIERFLDGLVSRGHEAGHVGSETIYGYIWKALERTLDDPGFDGFRDIVRRHALDNVPFPAGSLVLGQVLEKRRLHTAASAAVESKTTHQTLRAMLERIGLVPALDGAGRKQLTFKVDDFECVLKEYGAGLNVNEIRASTGIIHRHVLELIARGIIPTLLQSRELVRARHRVALTDVETFMDRLFQGAVAVETPTRRQVTLGRACLVASTNVGDLVSLILTDGLTWKGSLRGGRRYTDLLVDADEVMEILQRGTPTRRNMTDKDVRAEMMGMRHKFVVEMIAEGHLTVVKEFCPKVRRHLPLITRESFEAFSRRYVTLSELGHLRSLHWRTVRRFLASVGCVPAYVWDARGNAIYERTDALDAAMALLPLENDR